MRYLTGGTKEQTQYETSVQSTKEDAVHSTTIRQPTIDTFALDIRAILDLRAPNADGDNGNSQRYNHDNDKDVDAHHCVHNAMNTDAYACVRTEERKKKRKIEATNRSHML